MFEKYPSWINSDLKPHKRCLWDSWAFQHSGDLRWVRTPWTNGFPFSLTLERGKKKKGALSSRTILQTDQTFVPFNSCSQSSFAMSFRCDLFYSCSKKWGQLGIRKIIRRLFCKGNGNFKQKKIQDWMGSQLTVTQLTFQTEEERI